MFPLTQSEHQVLNSKSKILHIDTVFLYKIFSLPANHKPDLDLNNANRFD